MQRTGTESLDALLEHFEPARQPAHHRIRPRGDCHEQQHQRDDQSGAADESRRVAEQPALRRPCAAARAIGAHHPQHATIAQLHALRRPLAQRGAGGFAA